VPLAAVTRPETPRELETLSDCPEAQKPSMHGDGACGYGSGPSTEAYGAIHDGLLVRSFDLGLRMSWPPV